ncbi:hypothetical protein J5069_07315 [Candidatus Symbiopectobacterium sp. NZEC127]|uniref:hypothetical protein n=1 Tax=Candidatus Symbiopectobacterium sp. NZEC127 TaxID=2820472 RepID=UPI002227ECAA|nr:hypothetical protein [Candidatus Symbiopectobacterium sp. NZEC127]MCW2485704.1 hypothetical protein [Candidatus Symbiopectobacterium sp. NZEC127]
MANFIDALKASLQAEDSSTVAVTVRISQIENDTLQRIAEYVGTSRQEVIHQLIKLHAIPDWKRLQESDISEFDGSENGLDQGSRKQYFILNTNKSNSESDHDFMMGKGIAAAFEDDYIGKINRIRKGDVVFLYESRKGIVGYGVATGECIDEQEPEKYDHGSMRYQLLNDYHRLTSAVPAHEVKRIMKRAVPFAQTLAIVVGGDALLQAIQKK